ncbi:hypothetical protein Tco_0116189 [Tanacetum coccineum]
MITTNNRIDHQMAPKRTSTSTTPTMTQTAIKKLVANSIAATLKEAANIAQRLMDQFRHRHWYGLLSKYHAKIFCDEKVVHILIAVKLDQPSDRKCVIRFGKRRKLNPRYIGPFRILKRVNPVAFTLKLPEELSNVQYTFYISNLKKCLSDESLIIPIKELRLYDKLNFMEEPVEIMDREVKQLK